MVMIRICGGWRMLCELNWACVSLSMAGVYHWGRFPPSDERGCRTLCGFAKGARVFLFHEESAETVLRQERTAFYHFQLLPKRSVVGLASCQECLREGSFGSARTLSVFASGICADARTCAPADQRASQGYAVAGHPGFKAASIAGHAWEKEKECERAVPASVS